MSKRKAKTSAPGTRYKVLRGLSYPSDPKITERIVLDGEHDIPMAERKMERHEPGEIVDNVHPLSAQWLLEDGVIEEVP